MPNFIFPTPAKIVHAFFNEMRTFSYSPKDYIFSFTYPADKTISIKPYNPQVKATAQKIVKQITQKFPDLQAHFIGSSSLEIAGENDIDLFFSAPAVQFDKYLPYFVEKFGEPTKRRPDFIEWNTQTNGFKLDLTIIDPATKRFQEQIKIFTILSTNKKILKEYQALKYQLNGMPLPVYHRKRIGFFQTLLQQ